MSRVVLKTAKGPMVLNPSDKSVSICMCGLSKNQPFCDGSHTATLDEEEGKIYCYDENLKKGEEKTGCCGKCDH